MSLFLSPPIYNDLSNNRKIKNINFFGHLFCIAKQLTSLLFHLDLPQYNMDFSSFRISVTFMIFEVIDLLAQWTTPYQECQVT